MEIITVNSSTSSPRTQPFGMSPTESVSESVSIHRTPPRAFTLPLRNVRVSGRRARKDCATMWTLRFGGRARSLPLVAQQIAKSRKLAPVATVIPALGFRSRADHPYLVFRPWGSASGSGRRETW